MEKVNEQQDMSENQKRLLQQALDMLEEQALHIEAPMLPAGEELLNRIRAAISQQAEPAPAQDEQSASGVTIEKDMLGTVHIKLGDFDYIQIQYQYPYTDNASQNVLTKRIVELLTRPEQTEQKPEQSDGDGDAAMSLNLFELDLYKVIAADMYKVKYQDVTAGQRANAKLSYYFSYFYYGTEFDELPPLIRSVFSEELQEMGVTADELVAYYTEKLRASHA